LLVLDDFGIKYVGREHAEHLMASIETYYELSSEWTGSAYCGLIIDWDYNNGTLDLPMTGYINAAPHMYQNLTTARAEHAPHTWNPPLYGTNTQYIEETEETEDSSSLSPK
jgi:hypothetical protein